MEKKQHVELFNGITKGEPFPIGNFSPMGLRQTEYLDSLLNINAEAEAENAVRQVLKRLKGIDIPARIMLVVVDEPRNGWTQRALIDDSWRFDERVDILPKANCRWISVQLWTEINANAGYVQKETSSAIYRFVHRLKFGFARTLGEMMLEEGRALAIAGVKPSLAPIELDRIKEIGNLYIDSTDYATCFAFLYGDDASKAVGYSALGIPPNGGFDLAVSVAHLAGPPEQFVIGVQP